LLRDGGHRPFRHITHEFQHMRMEEM